MVNLPRRRRCSPPRRVVVGFGGTAPLRLIRPANSAAPLSSFRRRRWSSVSGGDAGVAAAASAEVGVGWPGAASAGSVALGPASAADWRWASWSTRARAASSSALAWAIASAARRSSSSCRETSSAWARVARSPSVRLLISLPSSSVGSRRASLSASSAARRASVTSIMLPLAPGAKVRARLTSTVTALDRPWLKLWRT